MFGTIFSSHSSLHISAMCHLSTTNSKNVYKIVSKSIITCLIQNCIQAFIIRNTFYGKQKQIFNKLVIYLICLTPQNNLKLH